MKSGLEGRNNRKARVKAHTVRRVSMKSGLEGRNKSLQQICSSMSSLGLNEVRPRRPEQRGSGRRVNDGHRCLNEVRPRRPEQNPTPQEIEPLLRMSQ